MRSLKAVGSIGLLGALLTVACGDSAQSLNPTAPSTLVAADATSLGAESGATAKPDKPAKPDDKGKPDKDPKDNGRAPTNGSPGSPTLPTNPITGKVQIEGLIESVSGTSITVKGQDVLVPDTAVIRHGSRAVAFSDLKAGDRVHVKARMQGTELEASEVKLQNPGDGDDEDDDGDEDEAAPGSVSVALFDATASETAANTGTFRLTRVASATSPLTAPLTVTFALTGTALNGTDYQTLVATATFLAGQATVDVVVTPIADALVEAPETVILTLTDGLTYDLGTPSTATVTITG